MTVGVDYTAAAWQGAGIGRYTRELIRAAVALGGPFRYVLFYAAGGLPSDGSYLRDLRDLCNHYPQVRAVPLPFSPRLLTIIWQRLRLPMLAEWFTGPLDLLHAPDFVLPPTRARTLLTVHDLTFLVHPDRSEPRLQRYLAQVLPHSLRRANLVLVDSRATGDDLVRLLGMPRERLRVVYPGVSEEFRPLPAMATEPVRQRLGLPERFLLFVGTLEPRKNLPHLLAALPHLPPDTRLVIAGRKGWLYEDIFATVARLQLAEQVQFLDFVADADLPALYNLAEVFVYPSLYEGFGLPVAEALACGTPTVTTNAGSLPEVAGNAALLVAPATPPNDSRTLAAAIEQARHAAARLREAGPLQARRFPWSQSGRALLACYLTTLRD
ncbi:MAG: glycosyltransferase family 4 protein [Chloroflexaceae bacterium]|nr:glycosyltransferase family 4 protein [Chloroflexaceae bacterium]NJO06853.1 glycosyltransferase family 4 protein [Chloroflexaceae bacterium]